MLQDFALLLLYVGHQSQIPYFWTKLLGTGLALGILLTTLALLFLLVRAVIVPRRLISLSDTGESQKVLGKLLLFPVRFTHMRFRPVKDRFDNHFLVVGVPVGLRCRVGNLLAVDDKTLDVSPAPGGVGSSYWGRVSSHLSCWFSFDAVRFLHRGDQGVDLREKLDNFLRSQNEDPAQWPYAYLMSVPQFLGWSRNVVSWWYLYSEKRELDAMIMEINNSYWEKRNVFLRVQRASEKPFTQPQGSETKQYLDELQLVQSLSSAPQASFYKGTWHKYVFASPFEKVDGVVSNRLMDPVQPESWKSNAPFSNMTTTEETGEVRMATRLTCDGPPVDPTEMSGLDVVKFALRWTVPGMLTTPQIFYKAIKVRLSGRMKMNSKPPVRSGSVGRPITTLEITLEPFFRAYLAHCVASYPSPLELVYLPCRSFTNDKISMRSPSYDAQDPSARRLTVEPTDPEFYTRIVTYPDARTALAHETKQTGHVADPTAQRLLVSDTALLTEIMLQSWSGRSGKTEYPFYTSPTSRSSSAGGGGGGGGSGRLQKILSLSRWTSTPTLLDDFVLSSADPDSRAVYVSSCLRVSMARALAFGSQRLLGVYILLGSCFVRWVVLQGVFTLPTTLNSGNHSLQDSGWRWSTALGVLGYFVVMRGLGAMRRVFR